MIDRLILGIVAAQPVPRGAGELSDQLMMMLLNAVLIVAIIVIHYESLRGLSVFVPRTVRRHRPRTVAVIVGLLLVHMGETWLFAIAYYVLERVGLGALTHDASSGLIDCAYFSVVTYTTLGFGDITPTGPLRLLCAMEAMTGIILIGWSISFTVIQMQRLWGEEGESGN